MKYLTKGKIVLYLAAIFVAGGVTGAVISWRESGEKKWKPPTAKGICDSFRNRLRMELGLTPEQLERLEPLLQKRLSTMEEIRTRTVKELEELICTSDAEIADALNLTPDQRAKLQQMERKSREHFGKGRRGGPPSPPPE